MYDTSYVSLQKEPKKKSEESLCELQETITGNNLCITLVPEDETKKGVESIFKEIMAENFPSLQRDLDIQVYKAHKSPNRSNPERSSPTSIVIKLPKIKGKEKVLKATRKKEASHAVEPPPP